MVLYIMLQVYFYNFLGNPLVDTKRYYAKINKGNKNYKDTLESTKEQEKRNNIFIF